MPYEDSKPQFERLLERVLSDKKLTSNSKSLVKEHIAYLQAQGRDVRTLVKHLYCMKTFVDFAEGKVDFKALTRKDIERIIAKLESSDYKPETKRNVKSIVKAFWRHFAGSDEYYPEPVRWIKTTVKRKDRLLPEQLLTEEDVMRMLDAANNARDKAIIATLFDSGIRVGELLGIRRRDIDLEGSPAHIIVNGKTGMRKIPVLFSVPYLATYLNEQKMRKPDEFLWNVAGSWSGMTQRADYSAIRMMLQRVAAKAGIEKPVHPHLFRHSRASDYAKRLSDQELKSFFGWVGGSRMAETYVHLSGKDIDNSVLQANGYAPQKVEAPKLKVRLCPRCHLANGPDAQYCTRCGSPLSIDVAMLEEKTQKAAISTAVNPDDIQFLVKQLVDMELEKRKKKGK